jgi:integrase
VSIAGTANVAPNGLIWVRAFRRFAGQVLDAGIIKPVGPHTLRHAFAAAALDAGVPLGDVQEAASHADPGPP